MKVRHDKIGMRYTYIHSERCQKQPREPAHGKQTDEAKRIKHRRIQGDGAFVERGGPVEYFDRGWDGHHIAKK